MPRLEEGNPKIDDGQAPPSNCIRVQGTAIDIGPLDQEVRKRARSSQFPQLGPQSSFDEGRVKVENSLSLHDRVRAHLVVAGCKVHELDGRAELVEEIGDPAALLVAVDQDANRLGIAHGPASLIDWRSRFLVFPRSGKI